MRKALMAAACFACACLLMTSGALAGQKKITLGHIHPVEHPIHQGFLKFKEYVEKESKGGLGVEIFPNSQLGDALTQISSLRMGTLSGFSDGVGWFGQLEGDYYLPATAYAIKNWDAYGEVMDGPIGQEMAGKLLKNLGLRVLDQSWARLPRNVLSAKPIKSIADLQGVKMRVPELKSYIIPWEAMGATPTPVAWAETYLALQQGVVDALESPVDAIFSQRLHEVAKYLVMTRHQMESACFVVSENFYNTLTDAEKKIVEEGAKAAKAENDKISRASEAAIIQKMKDEGVTVIEIDVQEFYDRAKNAPVILENDGTWTKGLAAKVAAINEKH